MISPLQLQSGEHKKAVGNYFSTKIKYWDVVYTKEAKNKFINIHMQHRMEQILSVIDNYAANGSLNILDVGCGTGVYMSELLKRKHNVFGFDISKGMVKEASKRIINYKNTNTLTICSDVDNIPFPDSYFNVVICAGVMEYLPDEISALNEMKRVLKSEGILIFTLPNKLKLKNLLDPYYFLVRIWKYFYHKLPFRKKKKIINNLRNFSTNEEFYNKRYTKKFIDKLIRVIEGEVISVVPLGYGPFTFWRKEFLPLNVSLKINSALEKFTRSGRFKFLANHSNRWIICTRVTKR